MPIIEEKIVDAKETLGKNKGDDTQEPTKEAVITQEPTTQVEQPHVAKAGTPIVDEGIECRRTPSSISRWNCEKLLLISELQKWKQEEISLRMG